MKGFLLEQERKRVLGGYIRTLQEKYGAEILLEEPLAPRVEIRGSQELSKGPSDAKITIVEFSDFECPFCSKVQGTLGEVLKAYPEDVRLVYRHFPLSFHRNALTASEATMCAQDQGKFWPMHDEIFSDQKNIAVDDLKKHAETIGLEMTEFNNCSISAPTKSMLLRMLMKPVALVSQPPRPSMSMVLSWRAGTI